MHTIDINPILELLFTEMLIIVLIFGVIAT